LGESYSSHCNDAEVIPIIRADFVEGMIYSVMEKTRAKLFQTPIDMLYEGRCQGQGKVCHFLFRNIPGGWLMAISNQQIIDYKVKRKDK